MDNNDGHDDDRLELLAAMWAGDVDKLSDIAPCVCCCGEHTFEGCPARQWYGCRGQYTPTRADIASWAAHYEMTEEQFRGGDS